MSVKLLYHGPLWYGSTSLQRVQAFQNLEGVDVIESDTGGRVGGQNSLYRRVRWKLRWPVDILRENDQLLSLVGDTKPDIVMVDNSKVITRSTISKLRTSGVAKIVYYTPDDVMGKHNMSHPLRLSFPEWDYFFTTKTFNIEELRQSGVRRPLLVGKSFDKELHRPLSAEEVDDEFEAFDCVFIGTYEKERCASINYLAEAGLNVVVYGEDKGGWRGKPLHSRIALRPSVFAEDYRRCWHHGKLALCFLRKLNRDRITQRTIEIAAMGRPMLAERTEEHDLHFINGSEYIGFGDDPELVNLAKAWVGCNEARVSLGSAGRERCLSSAYSSQDRARQMLAHIMN